MTYSHRKIRSIPKGAMKPLEKIPNYDPYIGVWVATVLSYLRGKPDTEDWRRIFRFNGLNQEGEDFLAMNGRIYPKWAINEYYKLIGEYPQYFK